MRIVIIVLLLSLTFSSKAIAYPQNQLKECTLSAKSNPNILGAPELSIENFCDCALRLIVDEGKEPKESANLCASKHFG